jgi:hypothetical protein
MENKTKSEMFGWNIRTDRTEQRLRYFLKKKKDQSKHVSRKGFSIGMMRSENRQQVGCAHGGRRGLWRGDK